MRALTTLLIAAALAAPAPAFACGMVIREKTIALAELMEEVDEADDAEKDAAAEVKAEPKVEAEEAEKPATDAEKPAATVKPAST